MMKCFRSTKNIDISASDRCIFLKIKSSLSYSFSCLSPQSGPRQRELHYVILCWTRMAQLRSQLYKGQTGAQFFSERGFLRMRRETLNFSSPISQHLAFQVPSGTMTTLMSGVGLSRSQQYSVM